MFTPTARILGTVLLLHVFMSSSTAQRIDDQLKIRVAAEWEPAVGVMIAWPLVLPEQLIVDLARKEKIFVVLEDMREKKKAEQKFSDLGIPSSTIQYFAGDPEAKPVETTSDEMPNSKELDEENESGAEDSEDDLYEKIFIWTRDWGPFAGFTAEGKYSLIDPLFADYPLSKLKCDSKLRYFPGARDKDWNGDEVRSLASLMNVDVSAVGIYLTGGNVMFDGLGTAISTCVTLNENRHFGVSENEYLDTAKKSLGIENYHIIPNFEKFGIQHIDCFLKLLDEERVLIARPPVSHESYQRYEDLVAQISKLKNGFGRPYKIFRIDAGEVVNSSLDDPELKQFLSKEFGRQLDATKHGIAAYTNSLILNKRIFVPLFGISTDKAALETWRAVMPGYEVLGYEFTKRTGSKIPWQSYDALHCRTRAVWDAQMLYMTHRQLPNRVAISPTGYRIEAKIVDYSRSGLVDDSPRVLWRRQGTMEWASVVMEPAPNKPLFSAVIPSMQVGASVEYFLAATDHGGRSESLPRTAPAAFYSFTITDTNSE